MGSAFWNPRVPASICIYWNTNLKAGVGQAVKVRNVSNVGSQHRSTGAGPEELSAAASLIPNFDFVSIRVSDIGIGIAWAEFASPEELAAGTLDFVDSRVNVTG